MACAILLCVWVCGCFFNHELSILFQKNVAIKKLNISWNGFAVEGAKGIGKALEENRTLKELDISNNRLEAKGVGELLKGLRENDTLNFLKVCMSICLFFPLYSCHKFRN